MMSMKTSGVRYPHPDADPGTETGTGTDLNRLLTQVARGGLIRLRDDLEVSW
jgi:hypothetical protein